MVEKGISRESADSIGEYVRQKGGRSLVESLINDKKLGDNPDAQKALQEITQLFHYCEATGITERVSGHQYSQELMSAVKWHEGASNYCNHHLSNHTFGKSYKCCGFVGRPYKVGRHLLELI